MARRRRSGNTFIRRRLRRVGMAAQNALEIVRVGRLGAKHGAPYEVVHSEATYRLRRYGGQASGGDGPLLLVPPLMVASEVYDIDPEVSAIARLQAAGVDVWMVDYGAPEREEGGMSRTLDDHVRAVSDAVERVRAETNRDVHVAGYSQGGMFAYQAAALRRSRDIASVITFGSPVDIHRNLPAVRDSFAGRMIGAMRAMVAPALEYAPGLPGKVTSTGFKMMSARKELSQATDFLRKLHDRNALERRESRRLFLGGEGFVAWPGPALRQFVDEVIVKNRMASGGLVIDGRPVTLADIECPILAFVGTRDDMARPASVKAIRSAAPSAETHVVDIKAGHFGLVVGSTAQRDTWPAVIEWIRWQAGDGPRPAALADADAGPPDDDDIEAAFGDVQFDLELVYDVVTKAADAVWNRIGDVTGELEGAVDNLRWQVPRLARLRKIEPDTRINLGRALADQARRIGDHTFFLWKGRAFTYQQANQRVDHVVRGLIHCGVRPGQRVGVLMRVRPSYLSIAAALSRLGATAVLIDPGAGEAAVRGAVELARPEAIVADPDHAALARDAFVGTVLVLGGGPARHVADGVTDMEAIDPQAVRLPAWYRANRGRADDVAVVIVGVGRTGRARAAHITNRRWAFSAYGAAASATLTPKDTVYCCLPLHHMAGTLVAAGGALVGGSRLALAPSFRVEEFWPEVRRYGATVVFYAGEMCRALVDAPHKPGERNHPVRMFAGSGMRRDVWRRLEDRFGPLGVLEFYASTEGSAVLANASGHKRGALGRPLPGSSELALCAYDADRGAIARDANGRGVRPDADSPGMLLARVDHVHPVPEEAQPARVVRDVFAVGDRWFVTGDLMRRDADGDYWYHDRAADLVRTAAGTASSFEVEDALYTVPEVRLAAAYGVPVPGADHAMMCAAVVLRPGTGLDCVVLMRAVEASLPRHAWPRFVRVVSELPLTAGHRPVKAPLRAAGVHAGARDTFRYDAERHQYVALDELGYQRTLTQLR